MKVASCYSCFHRKSKQTNRKTSQTLVVSVRRLSCRIPNAICRSYASCSRLLSASAAVGPLLAADNKVELATEHHAEDLSVSGLNITKNVVDIRKGNY